MGPIGVAAAPRAVSARAIRWPTVGGEQGDAAGVGRAVGQRQHPADFVRLHPHARRRRASPTRRSTRFSTPTTSSRGSRQHYDVLYTRKNGRVAHEMIFDLRKFKAKGVEEGDVAKRLMDYGFHAPTVSFPVPGTLMVEPTESEPKGELDRFCDALIAIRQEIEEVVTGKADAKDNVLKNAPHTAAAVCADEWTHPVLAREGGVSAAVGPGEQVLAVGRPHRQSVRRSQSDVRVPADGDLRVAMPHAINWRVACDPYRGRSRMPIPALDGVRGHRHPAGPAPPLHLLRSDHDGRRVARLSRAARLVRRRSVLRALGLSDHRHPDRRSRQRPLLHQLLHAPVAAHLSALLPDRVSSRSSCCRGFRRCTCCSSVRPRSRSGRTGPIW